MWVLDVIGSAGSGAGADSFHLVAGEWTVGRRQCHFNFQADASISRVHAVIRVGELAAAQLGDPTARQSLVLEDKGSRFGSFVNTQQCLGERELKHGDEVSFGAKRTTLRVRYQPYVLVASRIQRANRAQVNTTCQQIGMHLLSTERKDATHCIVDQGRVVATAKVLWALVYNQPVVCTPWLYAILERKSMSEPLPRCEDYLPTDENNPDVALNYLPNPRRKTLYHRHVVVFLTRQPMETLIAAMSGVVVAAYLTPEDDDALLKQIELKAKSHHVLVVEPAQMNSALSNATAGQSESRDATQTEAAAVVVERRVSLFQSIGTTFTTVQELAASVIFAKTPAMTSDVSFSSSVASYFESPAPIPTMSFPEQLSLRTRPSDGHGETQSEDVKNEPPFPVDEVSTTSLQASSPDKERTSVVKVDVDTSSQINITDIPIIPRHDVAKKAESPPATLRSDQNSNATITTDPLARVQKSAPTGTSKWQSRDARAPRKLEEAGNDDEAVVYKPLVEVCSLVVKRPAPSISSGGAGPSNGVNFKRFRKGNGYSAASTTSLFSRPTVISVTVNNPEREAYEENLAALEEQERIAEDLFAVAEGRKSRKLF